MAQRRRITRRLLALATMALVGAGASLPWWLPGVMLQVAHRSGVEAGSWTSHGWSGVEFRDVVFRRGTTRVTIGTVKLPALLLWPKLRPSKEPVIEASDVAVVIGASVSSPPRAATPVAAVVDSLHKAWTTLDALLPTTRMTKGTITLGGRTYTIAEAIWARDRLSLAGTLPWKKQPIAANLTRPDASHFRLHADSGSEDETLDLALARAADGMDAEATIAWRGQTARANAHFAAGDVAPQSAVIDAPAIEIDSALLGLKDYASTHASVHADWTGRSFTAVISAKAAPIPADAAHPPLAVDLRATGDLDEVRIESVQVTAPGIAAKLSDAVIFDLKTRQPRTPAIFSVETDLGAIPSIDGAGKLSGRAEIEIPEKGDAIVHVSGKGSDIRWRSIEHADVDIEGDWNAPLVELSRAEVRLADGGVLNVVGSIDLAKREVGAARIEAKIPGAALKAWLAEASLGSLEARADLAGPFDALHHEGSLSLHGFATRGTGRIEVSGNWKGTGPMAVLDFETSSEAGGKLAAQARVSRDADGSFTAHLAQARWTDTGGEWWHLDRPATLRYLPKSDSRRALFSAHDLSLRGDGLLMTADAEVQWPSAGRVDASVKGFDARRLAGFVPEAVRGARIDALALHGEWDHGPATLTGSLRASYVPVKDVVYSVAADFRTDHEDLAFGSLQVIDTSGVVLKGEGKLPLRITGDDAGFRAGLSQDGALALTIQSEENPVFWDSIAALTGWHLEHPKLTANLAGTLRKPRGELELSAATLRPPAGLTKGLTHLPEITGAYVKIVASDTGLQVPLGMLAIDNHWVTLKAKAPWAAWQEWRDKKRVAWELADFELASNPLPIAIASRVFPTLLAPTGEVSIKISHAPGSGFAGRVWLDGAALRPIGFIGAVRDIGSELDFEKFNIHVTRLDGFLGGQRVQIQGDADVTDFDQPAFDLQVKSSRVPLVRQMGLIVRAELDLDVKQERGKVARVSGRVDFGPSVFVSDLVSLVPAGGVDSPETRPPYFSVRERPFGDWKLDVTVHGESFLRVETPLFRGLIATDMALGGTLAEPQAVGWVWGTQGVVLFPFARMPLDQLELTLPKDDPYHPTILVTGTTRVLGYDVRVEVTGPASEPRLLFSSDPPLSSQEIFLMLTTGAMPNETLGASSSARASRLALFLGQNIASGLGLGDDRLSIRSGENFSREGRETIYVQYDLNGRWSLVGEYDRFDAYDGGLKFRIIDR